jgi:hypothetical protein
MQTALDWFIKYSNVDPNSEMALMALEMEKNQIKEAYRQGWQSNPCLIKHEIDYVSVCSNAYYVGTYSTGIPVGVNLNK